MIMQARVPGLGVECGQDEHQRRPDRSKPEPMSITGHFIKEMELEQIRSIHVTELSHRPAEVSPAVRMREVDSISRDGERPGSIDDPLPLRLHHRPVLPHRVGRLVDRVRRDHEGEVTEGEQVVPPICGSAPRLPRMSLRWGHEKSSLTRRQSRRAWHERAGGQLFRRPGSQNPAQERPVMLADNRWGWYRLHRWVLPKGCV